MKFGVREICDVVLKAKSTQKVGNKTFYRGEPVIYFDTLKTSSMEGAATTVYATGGKGNARLMAWEGERTLTFTMEDALISPTGFMILSGAGLIEAKEKETIKVHQVETTDKFDKTSGLAVYVSKKPYADEKDNHIFVMLKDGDDIISEPFIPKTASQEPEESEEYEGLYKLTLYAEDDLINNETEGWVGSFETVTAVVVDYYTEMESGVQQIEITPDKFGGNYYLEASTLFRNTQGADMPAEFIIPNCKIQSNFTFSMGGSGDPSTFTFTMDAFPDYTRFDTTKKVLAAIQVVGQTSTEGEYVREETMSDGIGQELKPNTVRARLTKKTNVSPASAE